MPTSSSWVVCESSGRWIAALRVALERQSPVVQPPPLIEVRTLPELTSAIAETAGAIGFVEVRPSNLATVLGLLAKSWPRNVRFVALLDAEWSLTPLVAKSRFHAPRLVDDVLSEAGSLAVIDSTRHISVALNLAKRQSISRSKRTESFSDGKSIVDRAWAALPWQDA